MLRLVSAGFDSATSWCDEDPVIHFANGKHTNIAVAIPADKLTWLDGPVAINIVMPANAPDFWIEELYSGYFHEAVTVQVDTTATWRPNEPNEITVHVTVNATGQPFSIRANTWGDVAEPRHVTGRSDHPLHFKYTVAA
jgi:hypothetical protein